MVNLEVLQSKAEPTEDQQKIIKKEKKKKRKLEVLEHNVPVESTLETKVKKKKNKSEEEEPKKKKKKRKEGKTTRIAKILVWDLQSPKKNVRLKNASIP